MFKFCNIKTRYKAFNALVGFFLILSIFVSSNFFILPKARADIGSGSFGTLTKYSAVIAIHSTCCLLFYLLNNKQLLINDKALSQEPDVEFLDTSSVTHFLTYSSDQDNPLMINPTRVCSTLVNNTFLESYNARWELFSKLFHVHTLDKGLTEADILMRMKLFAPLCFDMTSDMKNKNTDLTVESCFMAIENMIAEDELQLRYINPLSDLTQENLESFLARESLKLFFLPYFRITTRWTRMIEKGIATPIKYEWELVKLQNQNIKLIVGSSAYEIVAVNVPFLEVPIYKEPCLLTFSHYLRNGEKHINPLPEVTKCVGDLSYPHPHLVE